MKATAKTARKRNRWIRGAVYMLVNKRTGEGYIGASAFPEQRLYGHRTMVANGRHSQRRIRDAFAEHGLDALEIRILEFVRLAATTDLGAFGASWRDERPSRDAMELLSRRERYWIGKLNPKLNDRQNPPLDLDALPLGPPASSLTTE